MKTHTLLPWRALPVLAAALTLIAACTRPELPLPGQDDASVQTARRGVGARVRSLSVLPPRALNVTAFWPLDGSATEASERFRTGYALNSYTADRFGNANRAALFNGTTDIIEILDGYRLITPANTVSLWMKFDTTNNQGSFIMGCDVFWGQGFEVMPSGRAIKQTGSFKGNGDTAVSNDLYFDGSGSNLANGGWQGNTFMANYGGWSGVRQKLAEQWAHVVATYEPSTRVRSLYLNGQLVAQSDFNLWPAGDPAQHVTGATVRFEDPANPVGNTGLSTTYAFGFCKGRDASFWSDTDFGDYAKPGAMHYKGALDDIRFWNTALTSAEVAGLYASERN